MKIITAIKSMFAAKALPVSSPSGGGGMAWLDAFRKNRAASPMELIRECLGTAYTCSSLNSDLLASTRLRLFVKTRAGGRKSRLVERGKTVKVNKATQAWLRKSPQSSSSMNNAADVEEVIDHPVLDLLRRPNGDGLDGVGVSQYELFETTQRYLEVVGKCYWYTPRDNIGDTPSQVWLLPPQQVTEIPSYGGERLIEAYQFNGGMRATRYSPDEIVCFRNSSLTNPYLNCSSPMIACFEQVEIFRHYSAQTLALLQNGGRPDAIWNPKGDPEGGGIGPDEAKRMRSAMRQAFAMAGRGGVMVSEFPGSIQPLTWQTNDILPPEQALAMKSMVANCFQVPTTKLDRADSTMASATTGDFAHAKDAGLPRCNRFASTLNAFIIPMYDPEGLMFFAFDSCIPEDESLIVSRLKDGAAIGAVLRNEYREAIGLPAVDWGNQPLVPSNMVAVDAQGVPIPPVNPFAGFMGGNASTDATDPAADQPDKPAATQLNGAQITSALQIVMAAVAGELPRDTALAMLQQMFGMTPQEAESMMASAGKADVATTPNPIPPDPNAPAPVQAEPKTLKKKTVVNGTNSGLARKLPEAKKLIPILQGMFAEQLDAVLAQIPTKSIDGVVRKEDKPLPDKFIDLEQWTAKLARDAQPVIETIVAEQGKRIIQRLGASPEVQAVFEANIPKAAEKLALEFSKSTNATTSMQLDTALQQLRTEVSEGLVQGDTYAQLKERVQTVFDTASNARAEMIARTEGARATHTGELMGAKESKVVSQKGWLASADACELCLSFAEKGFIPLDDSFEVGEGTYGTIDAPPGHPGCVCSLVYQIDEET